MKKILDLYKKYEEIVNYIIVGGCTTVVSLATKWGLLFTVLDAKIGLQLQIANILSWVVAVTFAYVTNRIFVFKSKSRRNKKLEEMAKFYGSRVFTLILEMAIMWFFVTLLHLNSNLWVIVWTLVCQVLVTVLNYIISKFLVFIKKDEKNEKK